MNQFKDIQARLQIERQHLADGLKATISQSVIEKHEGSPFGKEEETAANSLEMERQVALARRVKEQLSEVERALGKLKQGTYGLCDSCGKPIPLDRLEAIPHANLCLRCKAQRAKTPLAV